METIKGTVEGIRFQNPETGWTIAMLRAAAGQAPGAVAVLGVMPGLRSGMAVSVTGERGRSRYGEEIRITSWEETRPDDAAGIERYLASGLIRDIGPELAHRIVEAFGTDTLEIMDNDPGRLMEVNGVGRKRAESIAKAVKEQREIRTVMIWLKRYGLPNGLAMRIFKKYGSASMDVIRRDPYRLADDFEGVGFKKADMVARATGIPADSPLRIRSGIIHALESAAADGSTCLPADELVKTAASPDILGLPEEAVAAELEALAGEERTRVRLDHGHAYLTAYLLAELKVALRVLTLADPARGFRDYTTTAEEVGAETGVDYADEQADAIRMCQEERIMVLTGGPGTGKTVTTKAIISVLEKKGYKVLLAAPTGRAAKRMTEVTGRKACTIHRLLEYQGGFVRNRDNTLDGDVVVVDESSMIDILLMKALLEAVPDYMKVVLVGDVDQLPSVGAGSVLRDMIDSGAVPCVRLRRIFRQAQDSDIIMNAHAINRGEMPRTDNRKGTDFWFTERDTPEKIAETVRFLVAEHLPKKSGFKPSDIQVLCPMKRESDPTGSTRLNAVLQEALNPQPLKVVRNGREFRKGDRVMQTKNDYEKGVFNGDMGTVTEVDPEERALRVRFDEDLEPDYRGADLDHLDLAYAITVHKSQGSEFPVVIIPLHRSQYVMLQRNLLYTAVTRAKRFCIVVGTREAVRMAAGRQDASRRCSLLKGRLDGSVM